MILSYTAWDTWHYINHIVWTLLILWVGSGMRKAENGPFLSPAFCFFDNFYIINKSSISENIFNSRHAKKSKKSTKNNPENLQESAEKKLKDSFVPLHFSLGFSIKNWKSKANFLYISRYSLKSMSSSGRLLVDLSHTWPRRRRAAGPSCRGRKEVR